MAAPILQAQGATSASTSSTVSPVVPAHVADDILIAHTVFWGPDSFSISKGTGGGSWAYLDSGQNVDGYWQIEWQRAVGAGTTYSYTHDNLNNDTGADTCLGARVYVIRGCTTSGNPWDSTNKTGLLTAANGAFATVTVSAAERMVVQFGAVTDNLAFAMTSSGWTTGTEDNASTGTDCAFQTARKDNVASSTGADTATVSAPAAGFYAFFGVSFKPPAAAATFVPYRKPMSQLLAH